MFGNKYMFSNEVPIDKADKERLVKLVEEAKSILDKYPYEIYDGSETCTAMSRAKSFVNSALEWCRLLYVKE